MLLDDVDVLVARSPAHYVSDIQKVKAVLKVELMGLKDVIVFSTKGNPSLAAKLSGGDYDGDIAWVCWEPSIVENFENADVPKCPNLLEEGFIRKNSTTYKQLVEGHSDPTSVFLKESFAFNMQQSLLGICTNFKEKVCYTQGSVNTPESVFLSTLLSSLVDQSKQGFLFTEDDWTRIKQEVIKFTPREPLYKTDHLDSKSKHIIDHLMTVAYETTERSLAEFHQRVPDPPQWDDDLAAFYKWAREEAEREPELKTLLDKLEIDIGVITTDWAQPLCSRGQSTNDESKPGFVPIAIECHEKFMAIRPCHNNTLATKFLDCLVDPEISIWALLKASTLFASYNRSYVSNCVWWVAGKQLAHLKAIWRRGMVAVGPDMYAMLKPDVSFVRAWLSQDIEVLQSELERCPSRMWRSWKAWLMRMID